MNRTQVKRKNRASTWRGITLIFALVLMVGCEEDDPLENPLDVRANYLGVWQVTENTGVNHPQFHSVTISAGTDDDEIIIDPKTNNSDCWIEARSNVKRPSGFLKRLSKVPTIAKPPQLPYE